MSYPVKVVRSRAGYFQQCSGAPSAETGRHLIYSHECSHYGFQRIYRQPLVQPSCGVRASGDAFVALSIHAGQRGLPGGGSGGMPRCHQSGRGAIDRRWTDAYKQELVESRIMTTRKLVEAVNRLHEPPEVMISTSAVGYYSPAGGCHGEQDDPAADSFLAELCVAWEKEAELVNDSRAAGPHPGLA